MGNAGAGDAGAGVAGAGDAVVPVMQVPADAGAGDAGAGDHRLGVVRHVLAQLDIRRSSNVLRDRERQASAWVGAGSNARYAPIGIQMRLHLPLARDGLLRGRSGMSLPNAKLQ